MLAILCNLIQTIVNYLCWLARSSDYMCDVVVLLIGVTFVLFSSVS